VSLPVRREGHVGAAGSRTWFRVVGEPDAAVPLVALHGGPGSTHHYLEPLERLVATRAVVLYDQLGCGSSDRPTAVEWSLDVFTDELRRLRAELGLERIHLLGTSWGGMLALEHVLGGAEGIQSLVLSSTLASIPQWVAEAKRLRAELPAETLAALDALEERGAYDDPAYAAAEAVFSARHVYRGPPRPELEAMGRERSPEVYRAMIGPNEWTVTGALRGWDVSERLQEIRLPTLVIRGRHDLSTAAVNATLLAGIPHAESVVLADSAHMPILEQTDRYLAVVGDFLARSEALSAA
jgi:proline-specific peptidase